MLRAHEQRIEDGGDHLSLADALMLIAALDRVSSKTASPSKIREQWLAVLSEQLDLPLVVELAPQRAPIVHDATGNDGIAEYVRLLARRGLPSRAEKKRSSMTAPCGSVRMLSANVDLTRWPAYATHLAGAGLADPIVASARVSDEAVLLLHAAQARPALTAADHNLVRFFMSELTRRSALLKPLETADDLPPRLAATLSWLLRGASEKEIASELDLSVHTVHQYVKMLYKTYGVGSRAQLMARCLGP